MAGMFDGLLADPYRMNLALNGLGLLGTKTARQAENYTNNMSQGLLAQAKSKAQARRDAETKRVNNSVIGYNDAKTQDLLNPAPAGYYEGTGAEASSLNAVATLGAKERAGIPLSPQDKITLQTAKAYLSRTRTGFGPGGQPMEIGGMDFNYMNPQQPSPPVNPNPTQQYGGSVPPQAPAIAQQSSPQVYPTTPAQIKTDELSAKEYVDWSTNGEAIATKNINQLMAAREALKSGKVETGDWKAFLSSLAPDKVVSYVRPDFMNTKEQVQEVVQANLTATLGAQFAEREGDRVIARAYNENVDTDLNIERVDRLIDQIVQTTDAKKSAMDYYQKNGTMVGYSADVNSMADLQKKLQDDFLKGLAEDNAGESDAEKELRLLREEFNIETTN